MIYNPLEQFEIVKFIAMEGPLFGYIQIGLTNIGFYLLLASLFLIFLHLLCNREGVLGLGNTLMFCIESLFGFILQLVKSQVGPSGQPYFPAIYSLFLFILFLNLIGLIPYSFTATAHFALTLGFSATIVLGVTLLGLHRHGLHFFSLFVPAGTPLPLVPLLVLIESVSYLARAFSLGIRLSANMLAGHILLHLISSFSWKFITGSLIGLICAPLPLVFLTLLYGLEVGIAFIQAYVFVLLTCSYIKDAISLHEESPSASSSFQNSPPKPFGLAKRKYSTLSNSSKNSTSVVLWGSNLSSTSGLRYSDKLRNIVSLPPFIYSIIIGLILSDGWVQKGKFNKNARLGFKQSVIHTGFALWVYNLLAHYCQSLPHLVVTTLNGQEFFGICFYTRAYPCLTKLHSSWYSDKIKVLPPTIFDDLTPVALAMWAQGDGTKRNNGFTFNTQSFTLQQVVFLLNILYIKFGLDCTIYYDRGKPILHVKPSSMSTFRTLVYPYFHLSMLYKFR
jgi:F-type H+-transporting ATPase subunit a